MGDLPVPEDLPRPQPPVAAPSGEMHQTQRSLVTVNFRTDRRFCTESSTSGSSDGIGLLVDAQQGLVLTDRHSAPQSLGDVEVTLLGVATMNAEVIFVHPLHNLAVLRIDPVALQAAKLPLSSAKLAKGAKASLKAGDAVHFAGFDSQGNSFRTKVTVAAVYLPSGRDEFPIWDIPRFRQRNLEIVVLADTPEDVKGGVLCDNDGSIRALLAQFDWQGTHRDESEPFGIPTHVFSHLVDMMRTNPGVIPVIPSLDIEVSAVDVAKLVQGAGKLPPHWLKTVGQRCSTQGQVARALRVNRIMPTGASDKNLKAGDVLLTIAGKTIACGHDIESALTCERAPLLKKPAGVHKGAPTLSPREPVSIKVFRDGSEVEVTVTPSMLGSEDDQRLVIWAGLLMRSTPRCILDRCSGNGNEKVAPVFIQAVVAGSPADSRGFCAFWFLMDIDGKPISSLDDVMSVVVPMQSERRWVRLRQLDLHGQEHLVALQCDPVFFPILDLSRLDGCWQCVHH